jgi:ABC-2 type transport system ATP-binding protein
MDMIVAQGLTKYYGKSLAVDHVSFKVGEGEVFGFLGPNGAGKTTTIKMLNTLIKIGEGKASVAGFDVGRQGSEVRRTIGLVPQEMALDRDMTGRENLRIQAKLYDVPEASAEKKIDELLELVDLSEVSRKPVGTYSWGMQRRLEIALGLVHTPKVLFLDEPTLGLDAQSRLLVWEHIRKLNEDLKVTIFLTTHYLEEADDLCDRIAIINAGTIRAEGTPDQLKRDLGADIVVLRLAAARDESELKGIIGPIAGVVKVSLDGAAVLVETSNGDEAVPNLIYALAQKGIEVKSVDIEKKTLNEVFARFVGKSLSSDEQEDQSTLIARERLLKETRG